MIIKQYMSHDEVLRLLRFGMDMKGWTSKDEPLWHSKVKSMWRGMWIRCYDPTSTNYKYYQDSIVYNDFKYLSNFVKWIMNEPRFEEFCNTCVKVHWTIDKDMKNSNNRNYYPEYMTLCTQNENTKARIESKGASMSNPQFYKKLKKPVVGINKDSNLIFIFKSAKDASEYLGIHSSAITSCCKGRLKSYKGYKWFYLDMNERCDAND